MNKFQLWRCLGLLPAKPNGRKQTVKWEKSEASEADCDCNLSTWTLHNFDIEMQLIHPDQISALVNSSFRAAIAGYHRPRVHARSEQGPSNLQNVLATQLQCKTLCCKIISVSGVHQAIKSRSKDRN